MLGARPREAVVVMLEVMNMGWAVVAEFKVMDMKGGWQWQRRRARRWGACGGGADGDNGV